MNKSSTFFIAWQAFCFYTDMKWMFLLLTISLTAGTIKAQTTEYQNLMDKICQHSNDYSGMYNSRQTWTVSYEACTLTDRYYFDGELTVKIELDLANMEKAGVEKRFYHAIVVYPTNRNPEYLNVTRYEDGEAKKITDGIYYNLMVPADDKWNVKKMMEQAIGMCQEGMDK